jgi:hypothetical protein
MSIIYTAETHEQILGVWQSQNLSSLKILHLDFHCDMRGLYVDRESQQAYRIWDFNNMVGQGNYITHAILERRIQSIRWVHDEIGGRKYDVGTVKYETDLTAIPIRMMLALSQKSGIPIHYEEVVYPDWTGLLPNEHLDIDWDFFASKMYKADTIEERVEDFLAREFQYTPTIIYVCYSPDFSHPSRDQFHRFISDLAMMFEAEVYELPMYPQNSETIPVYKKYLPDTLFRLARHLYYNIGLGLRKRGIY